VRNRSKAEGIPRSARGATRGNRIAIIVLSLSLAGAIALPSAHADEELRQLAPAAAALQPDSRRIAFKEDNGTGVGSLALRMAGGLVLMAMLTFAVAWLAKRYLPGLRGFSSDGQSRIQLLESRRITPKLTLFVLEFEGRRLLLAQSGERVVKLCTQGDRAEDE
jgi:flagellar biogenesis protein FliO